MQKKRSLVVFLKYIISIKLYSNKSSFYDFSKFSIMDACKNSSPVPEHFKNIDELLCIEQNLSNSFFGLFPKIMLCRSYEFIERQE